MTNVELQQLAQLEKEFRLELARRRETSAYELVRKAEEQLRKANEFWEACSTDVRMLEDAN